MRVLVTGGAGFIGSHVVDALCAHGETVRVLDDFSTGRWENVNDKAEVVTGDVAEESVVRKAVEGTEVVFHLAAHRAVLRSVEHPRETDRANTHGTLTVLKASLDEGVRRVVYASSSSVYGGATELPTPESAPTTPRSPYAVTKLAGEHYCRVFWELYGLETVSLRYFNVYGPRQRPDSAYAAVIPLFVDALLHRRPPIVHGDGRQSRDFTFVADAVAANLAAAGVPAARCGGRTYNIAGGRSVSLLEMLDLLARIVGWSAAPEHVEPRPGDVRHTRAQVSAARRDLGHEPAVAFEEGLARTVAWFRRLGDG
ncbi:MAG: NAD-dependent epimerase/dehydratase family protein [Actinomycetota bacterium]